MVLNKSLPRLIPGFDRLTGMSELEFKRYGVEAVSIAVQEGNHLMYADGLGRTLQNQPFVVGG